MSGLPADRPARVTPPDGLAPLLDGLERLAGLAPNDVLLGRLKRAGHAAAAAARRPPDLDDPHWAALLDVVTVQETRMFRAADQLAAFRGRVLAELTDAAQGRPLHLVSAGCATGEEAWTLAIIAARGGAPAWRVLGLDLCRTALADAAAARYRRGPPDALRDVEQDDRAMLSVEDGGFAPASALRPHVAFRRANLLDPLPTQDLADAILCRNVLIYLTTDARRAVLRHLIAGLRPGGALLLGPTDAPPTGLGPLRAEGQGMWRKVGGHG